MNEKKFAGRVGLIVFAGIVLIAALMLNFSRGVGTFKSKYEIKMRARTAAGLVPRAAVSLSGVQIGNVKSVELDQASKSVVVRITILKEFPLHNDSKFVIEQRGVLGDQFVEISPGSPDSPLLKDGDEVNGVEPFNLLATAESADKLLKQFDHLGATVSEAITRLNNQVLDARTLSNLSRTIENFQAVPAHMVGLIDNASGVISNAGPALTLALTNLLAFSSKLEKVAMEVDEAILTNRMELNESMKNLRDATASLKQMTAELQSGKGLAGGLLKDEQMRAQFALTISNLSIVSSNLARHGLLYKPPQPKNLAPPAYTGKSGFK